MTNLENSLYPASVVSHGHAVIVHVFVISHYRCDRWRVVEYRLGSDRHMHKLNPVSFWKASCRLSGVSACWLYYRQQGQPHETINMFCFSAFLQVSEGIDHLKMEILSSCTRPHAILMFDFLLWSTKDDVIRMFQQILQLKWMGMDISSKNGRKATNKQKAIKKTVTFDKKSAYH